MRTVYRKDIVNIEDLEGMEKRLLNGNVIKALLQHGFDYDLMLGKNNEYDSAEIKNCVLMLLSDLIIDNDVIIMTSFRARYDYVRIKDKEVVSAQVLNVDVRMKKDEFVSCLPWLVGDTIVGENLFNLINEQLWQKAKDSLNKRQNSVFLDNVNLIDTFLCQGGSDLIWSEIWSFIDIETYNKINLKIDFMIEKKKNILFQISETD